MKNVCLIPARGGSKRIPRKNIRLFFGKPLIAWSIEVAKSSGIFDEVYVSTDDKEIANIAIEYGAVVPFLRPAKLSNDFAIDKDVMEHFILWMKNNQVFSDTLCYLYATAPFITEKVLKDVKNLLLKSDAALAYTVTKYDYPVLKALKQDNSGVIKYFWEEFSRSRSQDLPELVHDAGQCYFYNLKKYGKENKTVGFNIPRLRCQDIDTLEDFKNAEKLFEIILNEKNSKKF
tara:strand:+ start:1367 stop:2062 length:696 start_codon:yes stop_codon:yes gene_type:complete